MHRLPDFHLDHEHHTRLQFAQFEIGFQISYYILQKVLRRNYHLLPGHSKLRQQLIDFVQNLSFGLQGR